MLKRGFLAGNLSFMSFAHDKSVIDHYLKEAEIVFDKVSCHKQKGDLETLLQGPVCHSGFQRLN